MPKAACCCKKCEWCDHNHDTIDWYNSGHLWYNTGNLEQCRQPNWNILGTLTTEIPSIGHVMPRFICRREEGLGGDPRVAYEDYVCTRGINLDTYGNYTYDPTTFGFTGTSLFRTPSTELNTTSYFWGRASRYGEIYPCWFNGLNMTNIEKDEDEFFKFTFKLKIEKKTNSGYQTIINTDVYGPGKNLRAHPDACSSYNVAGSDFFQWMTLTDCFDLHGQDSEGFYIPCDMNFAKMPRGPWPYRFKRNIQPNTNLPVVYANGITYEFPCRALAENGSPGAIAYTKEQVLQAREDPSIIGTPIISETGNILGIIGENILYCPLVETQCSGQGPLSGNQQNSQCCDTPYCSRSEICYELDEEGTPFGWEDVPAGCPLLSNYSSKESLRKFFCWWDPANRYTTPEWDLIDEETDESRKLSIHVVVPTKMFRPVNTTPRNGFCYTTYGEQSRSFGEWSFGMDLEATNNEIEALESSGYVWSNGREEDGVWINKTPTGALRVLFTMDHADISQGKVWRAFRDWDAKVDSLEKTFNVGTPEEVTFKISVEQKLEEIHFASLGCDCPSGYERPGPTGACGPTGSCGSNGSCGSCGSCGPTGAFRRILPSACGDDIQSCDQPIPGTTLIMPGFTVSNHLHCMNDAFGEASKISFAERGPIMLDVNVETTGLGCIVCNSYEGNAEECECSSTVGGTTRLRSNKKQNGMKMILHCPLVPLQFQTDTISFQDLVYWKIASWPSAVDPYLYSSLSSKYYQNLDIVDTLGGVCPQSYEFQPPPAAVYEVFREHGSRWMSATADMAVPSGSPASPMGGMRYRNSYVGLQTPLIQELDYLEGRIEFCGEPLYGLQTCAKTNPCPDQPDLITNLHLHAGFNEKPEDFPTNGPLGKCIVSCLSCKLRSTAMASADNTEGSGDTDGGNCGGNCGPNICGCCPTELYFSSDPPGQNCPPADPGCPNQNGKRPWCGEEGGEGECFCTECEPEPTPPDNCPHLVEEGEEGAGNGRFIYTDWGCSANVVSPTDRPGQAGCYDCADTVSRGEIFPTCGDSPYDRNKMYGMDSERLYLRAVGSNTAKGFLNNGSCKKYFECGCGNLGQAAGCWFTSYENGFPVEYPDYCSASSQAYGWGVGNVTVNWRKYLCQQRVDDGKLFEPDIIEKMVFECNAGAGCVFDYRNDYENLPDACKHIWQSPEAACYPVSNVGGIGLLYERLLCPTASQNCTPRDTGVKIEVSKYVVDPEDRGFLPFDTTYEPNPNRNLLDKNRSHIIIIARGASR